MAKLLDLNEILSGDITQSITVRHSGCIIMSRIVKFFILEDSVRIVLDTGEEVIVCESGEYIALEEVYTRLKKKIGGPDG